MKNIKQFLLVGTLIFGGTLAMEREENNDFISPKPPVWDDLPTETDEPINIKAKIPGESEWEKIPKPIAFDPKQYPVHALLEDLNKILANKDLNPEKEFFYDNVRIRNLNSLIGYMMIKKITDILFQNKDGIDLVNSKNPYAGNKTPLQIAQEHLKNYKDIRWQKATYAQRAKFSTYDTDPVVIAWNKVIARLKSFGAK